MMAVVTFGRKAETPFELCLGSLLVAGAFKFHCCVFRGQFFVVAQSAIGVVADANFCHCKQDDFFVCTQGIWLHIFFHCKQNNSVWVAQRAVDVVAGGQCYFVANK